MQIGFVGLGKMGGNMVHRIRRDSDHEVVAFDFSADAVKAAEEHGASGADSLESLVSQLTAPRARVGDGAGRPADPGDDREAARPAGAGDTIIDGGNSEVEGLGEPLRAVQRPGHQLHRRRHQRRRVGTRGRLLHDGRRRCGRGRSPRRRSSTCSRRRTAGRGWAAPAPGHYVKMVHNGIEYGMMQAYAEGFELLHKSEYGLDVKQIADVWGQGSVVRSWLLELAVAGVRGRRQRPQRSRGLRQRLRRGPLDARVGDRSRRADAGAGGGDLRPVHLPGQRRLHRADARRAAQPVRRPRGQARPSGA